MKTKINKGKINNAIKKVNSSLTNTKNRFQTHFKTLDTKSKTAMNQAFYELECATNVLKKANVSSWSQTRKSLDCAADAAYKAANNCREQIRNKWKTLPTRAKSSIANSITTLQQSVRNLRRAIVNTLSASISSAKNQFKKATNQTLTAANQLQKKAQEKMRVSQPKVKQKLNTAMQDFRKTSHALKKATATALEAAHEKFSTAANLTLQAAKRLQNNMRTNFKAIQPQAKQAVNKAIDDLKSTVESLQGLVSSPAR
jgi:hypothetical protein